MCQPCLNLLYLGHVNISHAHSSPFIPPLLGHSSPPDRQGTWPTPLPLLPLPLVLFPFLQLTLPAALGSSPQKAGCRVYLAQINDKASAARGDGDTTGYLVARNGTAPERLSAASLTSQICSADGGDGGSLERKFGWAAGGARVLEGRAPCLL
ncbi:hypothetical protein E2C01_061958 [Portunus trituberculatus]|uniref:Uncharacterized protein n=1 Tax=Portunus trituberculatus TaxID=210409 RepID=A0A5B7HGQ8_PORTR|nr:hypothetical protein [Portunus trituberculatus]